MQHTDISPFEIVLASSSQRRISLLQKINLPFSVIPSNVDETYSESLKAEEIPLFLSEIKAESVWKKISNKSNKIVVSADTIVWCGNEILQKPRDAAEAKRILEKLSDNTHQVFTGVCILNNDKKVCFVEETKVKFGSLSYSEIDYYISTEPPFDKAGAYGIQDFIGMIGVEKIDGCYYNVMGFPMHRFFVELKKFVSCLR